jgi:hypothetical protein
MVVISRDSVYSRYKRQPRRGPYNICMASRYYKAILQLLYSEKKYVIKLYFIVAITRKYYYLTGFSNMEFSSLSSTDENLTPFRIIASLSTKKIFYEHITLLVSQRLIDQNIFGNPA